MPGDYTLKVQTIREQNGTGANGQLEKQMLVMFMIGDHGPFSKSFPADNFDVNKAKAELAQFGANIRLLAS